MKESPREMARRFVCAFLAAGDRRCPRELAILLSLMLTACSSYSVDPPPAVDLQPSTPTEKAIVAAAKQVALDAKLVGPLEISGVRPSNVGLGSYFVCMRQADPAIPKRQPYAIFFNNDKTTGSRQSVIMETCETQMYTPIIEPPPPPPNAKPGKKRKLKSFDSR